MNIDTIKLIGEIKNIEEEIRDRLWNIKMSVEEAGKANYKMNFYKLPEEINKMSLLLGEIRNLHNELLQLRKNI
jgi:hypothetical protein